MKSMAYKGNRTIWTIWTIWTKLFNLDVDKFMLPKIDRSKFLAKVTSKRLPQVEERLILLRELYPVWSEAQAVAPDLTLYARLHNPWLVAVLWPKYFVAR